MLIVGFSSNTSKIIPRIFCRTPRHCAPIISVGGTSFIMYQFVRRGHIAQMYLNQRAIRLLRANGWCFIVVNMSPPRDILRYTKSAISCVDVCKRAIQIHAPLIQTPRALYRLLACSNKFQ